MVELADHYLEPTLGGNNFLYPDPNPALAQILIGPGMDAIVTENTAKVLSIFVSGISSRPIDPTDRHRGQMLANTTAEVKVGGYKNDRFVGEIRVGVDYGASDQYGRKSPSPGQHGSTYAGHYALTTALYSVLPQKI